MSHKYIKIAILLLLANKAAAQQFIGNSLSDNTAIQLMPYNPAWVNNSHNGTEFQPFAISALAGTNAYYFDKNWILGGGKGQARGEDYMPDKRKNIKHAWGNFDVLGPAVSFRYKDEHHFGIYTRYRQIVRGGNISSSELRLIGEDNDTLLFNQPISVNNAGFINYTFGEIGFSYGKILIHDDYNFFKAGVTLKYLAGFSAANIYINNLTYERQDKDTLGKLEGDITTLYTYNLNPLVDKDGSNDRSSWGNRAGKNGLGIDIGFQYQYHPDGNPNSKTPYLFSLAASITDIGSVSYIADTGSANYQVQGGIRPETDIERKNDEEISMYLLRLVKDTLLYVNEDYQKFRVGLPTALRINCDWNIIPKFNMAVNILLSLKGNNGKVYNPGYASYFNLTPSYGIANFRVGVPLTFTAYRTAALGLNFRLGPLYMGSSSLFSSVILGGDYIRNIDFYAGLSFKIPKGEDLYWYR